MEDRLFRAVGALPNVELAWRNLDREASERYKGFVVRSMLRVLNEAVKSNATEREEVRRFPGRYIDYVPRWARAAVEPWDMQRLSSALPWLFCSLPWFPASGVLQLFSWFPPPSGGGSGSLRVCDYWKQSPWCVEAGRSQQIARTRWSTLWSVLEAAAHVCTYCDGCSCHHSRLYFLNAIKRF